MSVILKALKKLEADNASAACGAFRGTGENQSIAGSHKSVRRVLAGFLVCGGIIAGAMIFSRPPFAPSSEDFDLKPKASVPVEKKTEETASEYGQPVPAVSASNHGASDFTSQQDPKNPLPDVRGGFREMPAEVVEASPAEDPLSSLADAPVMPAPDEKELTLPPVLGKTEPGIPIEKGIAEGGNRESTRIEKTSVQSPVTPKSARLLSVIEDPELSLQAISWSADPEKRLAIINGKICREKETVAGYVIDAIHSGAVEVTKGGKSGKLIFKIR